MLAEDARLGTRRAARALVARRRVWLIVSGGGEKPRHARRRRPASRRGARREPGVPDLQHPVVAGLEDSSSPPTGSPRRAATAPEQAADLRGQAPSHAAGRHGRSRASTWPRARARLVPGARRRAGISRPPSEPADRVRSRLQRVSPAPGTSCTSTACASSASRRPGTIRHRRPGPLRLGEQRDDPSLRERP